MFFEQSFVRLWIHSLQNVPVLPKQVLSDKCILGIKKAEMVADSESLGERHGT
jgi:hypothetical protein